MNGLRHHHRNVVSEVVAAVERLISPGRVRAAASGSALELMAGTIRTPMHLHDAGFHLPRDRSAAGQNTVRRDPRSTRAHRHSAVAQAGRASRLSAVLAGYIPWWHRRANDAPSAYAGADLRPLLDAMPVAVMVVDDDYRVMQVNEPAAALFGYTTNELCSLSFMQLCPRMADDTAHDTADDTADDTDKQAIPSGAFVPGSRAGTAGVRRMAVARCRDGGERPVSVQCTRYEAGASPWIVTIVDPCEHAHASADDLKSVQPARVSDLSEMAAALAHEINQPLTAILGNAQAAQRFLQSPVSDPDNLREALADIVDDSFRATEIVRKLRQLVRGATPETRPLAIDTLVRGATHLMRRSALALGVSVTLDVEKHLPQVRGDNTQLQQVMINLLQNAFDAVEQCSAEHRVVSVRIRAAPQQAGVSITVNDRGQGLNADQVGDVFKPFFTSKMHGLGLGLSISSSIISMHGGRLWADNNDDGGATFHILLPSAGGAEGLASGSRYTS
jgi:two-component system, LuxR family, sensor kinase FixL